MQMKRDRITGIYTSITISICFQMTEYLPKGIINTYGDLNSLSSLQQQTDVIEELIFDKNTIFKKDAQQERNKNIRKRRFSFYARKKRKIKHKSETISQATLQKNKRIRIRRRLESAKAKVDAKIGLKYKDLASLHELWYGYFESILTNLKSLKIFQLVSKCDFHGALLTVTQSNNPCLIGKSGIVIQETKNSFNIVDNKDSMKTIPKKGSHFSFTFDNTLYTINGDSISYTSAKRGVNKFKYSGTHF